MGRVEYLSLLRDIAQKRVCLLVDVRKTLLKPYSLESRRFRLPYRFP